jgi:cell division initiation protein
MIDLTPLEVRQKKGDFRRGFRGYDAELVNDFLDLVADRMEELVRENLGLKDVVESMETELKDYRQKEQALSGALMTAQRLQEDARAVAEKEGELLIREARLAAAAAREEAARAMAREEETLRQVRGRRGQLVESFRRLLERELAELAVIEEALELEAEAEDEAEAGPEDVEEPDPEDGPQARHPSDDAEAAQEDWLSSLVEE